MLLFEEQLSVDIPNSFQDMERISIDEMYPCEEKPQIILEDKETNRFCTFSLLDNHTLIDLQLEYAIHVISKVVVSLYPSCLLDEAQLKDCKDGACGWFSFKSIGNRGEIFNIMYIYPVNGCMMLGTMGCIAEDEQGQSQLMHIMESLQALKKTSSYIISNGKYISRLYKGDRS